MNFICDNETTMRSVINHFKQDKPKKKVWANFRIEKDKLIYKTKSIERYWSHETSKFEESVKYYTNLIAIKTSSGRLLGNATILELIGAYSAFGNQILNRGQTLIQRLMESDDSYQMIPFQVFEQANLDISTFTIISQGQAETVTKKIPNQAYSGYLEQEAKRNEKKYDIPKWILEEQHFIGWSLFKVGDSYFLFDIDRNEIKHNIFNPFLVKLPKPAQTREQAYEMLKPLAVKKALKNGLKVLRQGEWFFIPCADPNPKMTEQQKHDAAFAILYENSYSNAKRSIIGLIPKSEINKTLKRAKSNPIPSRITLQAGKNRPNVAESGVKKGKKTYVTGTVSHSGREHEDLKLNGWYEAHSNTAFDSFTITGDID